MLANLAETDELISPDLAERLALIVGASPEFWQNLSETYRQTVRTPHG